MNIVDIWFWTIEKNRWKMWFENLTTMLSKRGRKPVEAYFTFEEGFTINSRTSRTENNPLRAELEPAVLWDTVSTSLLLDCCVELNSVEKYHY